MGTQGYMVIETWEHMDILKDYEIQGHTNARFQRDIKTIGHQKLLLKVKLCSVSFDGQTCPSNCPKMSDIDF